MTFEDFIGMPRSMAIVITKAEYMDIRSILQRYYSDKDIQHIDEHCFFKSGSHRFFLCNPALKNKIITPMMYLDAVTFVDRVQFKDVEF